MQSQATIVLVKSATRSETKKAELYPSGLIRFIESDEWSHIQHEKYRGMDIFTLKDLAAVIPLKDHNSTSANRSDDTPKNINKGQSKSKNKKVEI